MRRPLFSGSLLLAIALVGCARGSLAGDGGPESGVLDGTTGDGGEGGVCMQGAPDEPDPANFDANCDGIDGDVARAVFVAPDGNDSAMGTREAPVRTLRAALALASRIGRTQVLMATGSYVESMTLRLVDGVGIYGGYVRMDWSRGMTASVLNGASVAVDAVGIRRATTVARLTIRSSDAMGAGEPSVALRAVDSAMLRLVDNATLAAGRGANGSAGSAGMPGAEGSGGDMGGAGSADNQSSPGGGGPGGQNGQCPAANGGNGGGGGQDSAFNGDRGQASGAGIMGGVGGTNGGCSGNNGDPGQTGTSDGTRGTNGMPGVASGRFDPASFVYQPANGSSGMSGAPGAGGGGGGGSSGQTGVACIDGAGNGGGGGGAGGCGGSGGGGGGGGGASVGLLVIRSPMILENVTITTVGGGAGGVGASGGAGGAGGRGGGGGSASTGELGRGGFGGDGRQGGEGGAGAGGGGGPSMGIWVEPQGMNPQSTAVVFRLGDPGAGGASAGGTPSQGQRGLQRESGPN